MLEINGIVVSKNVFGVTEHQVSSELCVGPHGTFQAGPTKSSRMPQDVTAELCIDGLTPSFEFQRNTNIVLVTLRMCCVSFRLVYSFIDKLQSASGTLTRVSR